MSRKVCRECGGVGWLFKPPAHLTDVLMSEVEAEAFTKTCEVCRGTGVRGRSAPVPRTDATENNE